MSQEEEISQLRDIAKETENFIVVNSIIYNLAAYGPKSIPAISEIIELKPCREVRSYGLETIKMIREQGRPHLTPPRRF